MMRVQVSGGVSNCAVALCVSGDDLNPDEITAAMGLAPSMSARKGERVGGPRSRGRAVTGYWRLHSALSRTAEPEAQVEAVLAQLPADQRIWADLAKRFEVRLDVSIHMKLPNEGLLIPARLLGELKKRGIMIDIDIYGPSEAWQPISDALFRGRQRK